MKLKCKARRYLSLFSCNNESHIQNLRKSNKIARKYGKNKVILIILRLKFLKTWASCAIGTSLPELQYFFSKEYLW